MYIEYYTINVINISVTYYVYQNKNYVTIHEKISMDHLVIFYLLYHREANQYKIPLYTLFHNLKVYTLKLIHSEKLMNNKNIKILIEQIVTNQVM